MVTHVSGHKSKWSCDRTEIKLIGRLPISLLPPGPSFLPTGLPNAKSNKQTNGRIKLLKCHSEGKTRENLQFVLCNRLNSSSICAQEKTLGFTTILEKIILQLIRGFVTSFFKFLIIIFFLNFKTCLLEIYSVTMRIRYNSDPGQLPTGIGTDCPPMSSASAQMKLKKIAFARETISKQLQNCLTCCLRCPALLFFTSAMLPNSLAGNALYRYRSKAAMETDAGIVAWH